MTILLTGMLVFVGFHLLISGTGLRNVLVGAIGDKPFLGVFTLGSLVGLGMVIYGYTLAMDSEYAGEFLWDLPQLVRPVTSILTLVGLYFFVASFVKNPTSMGGEEGLDHVEDTVVGILRITRHPLMWGFSLWAIGHLLSNGELPNVLLFGTILTVAFIGTFSLDGKRARTEGDRWTAFAQATSNIPFMAIITGRNRLRIGELGIVRPVIAVVLFAGFFLGHEMLFGVSPLPV